MGFLRCVIWTWSGIVYISIHTHKPPSWQVRFLFFILYKSNSFLNLLSDVRWPFYINRNNFIFSASEILWVSQEHGNETCQVLCGTVCVFYNLICMCFIFVNESLSWHWQVDAFTHSAFKGNPAVVCFLEEDQRIQEWLQVVATEFNIPTTCYLTHLTQSN